MEIYENLIIGDDHSGLKSVLEVKSNDYVTACPICPSFSQMQHQVNLDALVFADDFDRITLLSFKSFLLTPILTISTPFSDFYPIS